ncbi:condensin-2 complex subunit D3 [Fistulifera solaris]|uniref:Condensin-2 complex subunit D3 n=1 Tax=Fistulifera solaris TaxID=1519565 RepID=A0A1Z5KQ42_FISSO|nr:condensin-2 complex subunit D3 [Fistulifera solaris]|eukprot:GAX28131.1 condensin-2 complex subunit D3 [Fistulifera solaris]
MTSSLETALHELLTSENTVSSQIERSLRVVIHCLDRECYRDEEEECMLHRNVTVRNILPESTDLSSLIRVLESLLSTRVPTETVLPGTYDEEANEHALSIAHSPALTLTTVSLLSARMYAQLLALPGALGVGLVEAPATSALAALLRRWREECIGRERAAWKQERCDPNEDDSDESMVEEEVTDDSFLSPVPEHQLVTFGLEVLVPLSGCLLNREFLTWSSEARDSIVDAVVTGMATSEAISSVKITLREETLCRQVITAATESIRQCLVLETTNDYDEEDDDGLLMERDLNKATKRRETLLAILRTTYPSIVFKDVVPNGEQGKQAACQASSYAFELFVKNLCAAGPSTGRLSLEGSRTRRSDVAPPKISLTPSNRSSIGSSARITPAKLKSTIKASRYSYDSMRKIDSMHAAIVGTLQKITTDRELEKTNIRRFALETVLRTLAHLQPAERERFLSFVIQLCHSKVSLHRLVGCQLTGDILVESWLWKEHAERNGVTSPSPAASVDRRKSLSPLLCRSRDNMTEALFGVLVGRLQDRIPTIRMTSASCFAKIFDSLQESTCDEALKTSFADFLSLEGHSLAQTLRKRANDDKATVRRSAVEALSGLLMICHADDNNILEPSGADVDLFNKLCNDESVMVRKVSAEALTNLLRGAISKKNVNFLYDLETAWSSSVLVMVLDSEPSCAAKALELINRIVLAPIMDESDDFRAESAWRILASIQEGSSSSGRARSQSQALRTFVANTVTSSDASATTKRQIVKEVVSKCASTIQCPSIDFFSHAVIENHRTGAWCLLDALVSSFSKPKEFVQLSKRNGFDLDFLGSSWEHLCQLSDDASGKSVFNLHKAAKYALKVLSKVVTLLGKESAQDAAKKLYHRIHSFSLTTEVIGDAITALVATTSACTDNSVDAIGRCKTTIEKMYSACEDLISSQLASTSDLDYNAAKLGRAIFSVGDLSLVGFHPSDDKRESLVENHAPKQSSTEEDPVRGLHVSPGPTLARLIQAFLPHHVAGTSGVPTPESLRAHAYLAVGKICLRDETLCKQSLNILARELHENMQQGSWRVQSNALLVLSDLCVQYTSMVDRYLPVMAACMQAGLKDLSGSVLNVAVEPDSAIVRKHAVTVLASLLLQDYIKWRGLLFYRFLVATVDEDEEVANLAEMLLCGPLITKQPRLFSNNFVEAIFVLNRCTAHPIYLAATANDDQGSGAFIGFEGIYLSGEVGRARRMQIYQLLLSRVSDEEKLGLTARITKEVLGSALKGGNDLHEVCTNPFIDDDEVPRKGVDSRESAMAVLSDALAILSDPSMKVGRSVNKDSDEEDIEDPNVTSNASKTIQVAKVTLFSKISKKHLLEILLPILCQLKVLLQKSQSPLLKNLMSFLVDVYRQNKDETKEFLANEPSLYQEIEYDARQFIKKRAWRTPAKKSKNAATLRTPLSVKQ